MELSCPSRAGLLGWYGYSNLGDELMLQRLAGILGATTGETPVIFAPEPGQVRFPQVAPQGEWTIWPYSCGSTAFATYHWARGWLYKRPLFLRALRNIGALVVGGGTIVTGPSRNLECLANQFEAAKGMGRRVILFGIGAAYIDTEAERELFRRIAHASDAIFARDAVSAGMFAAAGVGPALVQSVDPLYALPTEEDLEAAFAHEPSGDTVALSVRVAGAPGHDAQSRCRSLVRTFLQVAGRLTSSGLRIRLVPLWPADIPYCDAVVAGCKPGAAEITSVPGSLEQFRAAIRGARSMIAMPLHAVLLGAMSGIPVLPLSYHPKCAALCRELGIEAAIVDIEGRAAPDPETIFQALKAAEQGFGQVKTPILKALLHNRSRAIRSEHLLARYLMDGRAAALDPECQNQNVSV
jgi:polysaccharide pyruvyl transferase WcaK-like protein